MFYGGKVLTLLLFISTTSGFVQLSRRAENVQHFARLSPLAARKSKLGTEATNLLEFTERIEALAIEDFTEVPIKRNKDQELYDMQQAGE